MMNHAYVRLPAMAVPWPRLASAAWSLSSPAAVAAAAAATTVPATTRRARRISLAQTRCYAVAIKEYRGTRQLSEKEKLMKRKEKDKRKVSKTYHAPKLEGNIPRFSLCDAIRILRAAEVGQPPSSVKYELFVRLRTNRDGPVVRNRIQLPHPFQTEDRIGVVCPEDSAIAADALSAGAVVAGEESLFTAIREGRIMFTKLICHADSEPALNKAGLGRILGPKGLMPNKKNRTITRSVRALIGDMVSALEYRERAGVVRMPIAAVQFTPRQVAANIKALMNEVKAAARKINLKSTKELHEVVLSSSHGPGISLNGVFNSTDEAVTEEHLSGPL